MSLLESALASPQNSMHYGGQTDLFQLAGILSYKIIRNHAYMDGNKRIALLVADAFLRENGFQLPQRSLFAGDFTDTGLKDAHVTTASGNWTAEDLTYYYLRITKSSNNIII